ncbi:MAG: endonuclease III [Treponema sp.]|nr:endonuclease III [Treponema sp.]
MERSKKNYSKDVSPSISSLPDWEVIFKALDGWREDLRRELAAEQKTEKVPGTAELTAVTTVAERYRMDPWAVLASTMLSLRTKDAVTLESSGRLLEKAPDPASLSGLTEEEIARLIYPVGFYRTKAANLKKIAAILLEKYAGKIPADMDTLLSLPGVGRKTANLVLAEAYNLSGLCVDTHVHRISNRAGWVSAKTPNETEQALRIILPERYWKPINPLLVLYGQQLCRPISPFCSCCVIKAHCRQIQTGKTR